MLVLVFSYMYLLTHIYKNIGNIVNSGINGGLSFKVGPESKSNTTSTDERIAQLEKRIQELERSKK